MRSINLIVDFRVLRMYNFFSSKFRQNLFDNSDIMKRKEAKRFNLKGDHMTTNEQELISLIREQEDPARALATAVDIILLYLEQHGSSR